MKNGLRLSRTEVICVLVCLFVFMTVFHAGANMSREHFKRQVCANNIRINNISVVRYAEEHDGFTPSNYSFSWLQDLHPGKKDVLIEYGANPYTFFCPSDRGYNTYKNPDSVHWSEPYTYIVSSYFWMTIIETPPPSGSGDKQWVQSIDVANPSTTELMTDTQFSDGDQPDSNYAYVQSGSYYDYTNHREGAKGCAGGNIGFVDTHVQWRPFSEMELRWQLGPYNWW